MRPISSIHPRPLSFLRRVDDIAPLDGARMSSMQRGGFSKDIWRAARVLAATNGRGHPIPPHGEQPPQPRGRQPLLVRTICRMCGMHRAPASQFALAFLDIGRRIERTSIVAAFSLAPCAHLRQSPQRVRGRARNGGQNHHLPLALQSHAPHRHGL